MPVIDSTAAVTGDGSSCDTSIPGPIVRHATIIEPIQAPVVRTNPPMTTHSATSKTRLVQTIAGTDIHSPPPALSLPDNLFSRLHGCVESSACQEDTGSGLRGSEIERFWSIVPGSSGLFDGRR